MCRRRRTAVTIGLCGMLTLAVCAGALAAPAAADPFAACRRQFAEKPDDYDSSYCFYQSALQAQRWDDGAAALEALMRDHPLNWWVPLAYGHMHRDRNPERAESLYRRAADGFRTDGHRAGEIVARSNLRNFLFLKGRLQDAAAELDRVAALEPIVADPLLKAQIWTLQALHVQDTGGDLGVAYRLLKRAERATQQAPYRLKRNTLGSLAMVSFRLGRVDEALALYAALEQMAAAERDPRQLASARYNLLNVSSLKETLLPTPGSRRRLMALAERSLTSGEAGDHAAVTMKAHRAIAALLAADPGSQARALGHVRQCLALAATARQPHDEAVCSWLEARLLRERDAAAAAAAVDRALEATARTGSPMTQAYSAGRHMRLSWDTRSRPEALGDSRAAIEAVETLRSLQDDAASSAELFSIWTLDYYWLSGRLLRDGREDEIDAAFSITERMRGRALLDQVTRLHHRRLDPAHPAVRQRRSLLEQIAGVQRRLMSTALTDAERQAALEDLEQLEAREQDARHQIAVASGGADVPAPAFATIGAVQSALGEGEALLSYQVGIWETFEGEFGGGSWVIVVTRGSRTAYRLPDRGELAPLVPVFNGLLAREAEVSSAASARLYDEVIGQALRELPPGIDRLIVIPDGPLHRLPFDALHAAQDARPLAARYQLVAAPSATLWLRWHANTPPSSKRALSFADPEFTAATTAAANERNVVLQHGLRLGRLPHALRESRALRWHVSTSVDALVGREASEQALKQRDLRDYGVLHFAAHAFADESRPDRSAVLLAPGGGDEDGLLQAREIEELDLYGRVVVLSACRTTSGAVLNGEGVLSLARAFFAAGARSVVGTRWPVGDADAAALFDVFYRALGRGATLADALQQAKLAAIEEGRPAAVWASLVLLGDGAVRPFHDESPPSTPRTLVIGGALSAMMALALAVKRLAPSSP